MEQKGTLKTKSISGMVWLTMQYGGTQLVRFTIGVILARLIDPANYTVLSLITIFTSFAEKFISHGFTSALIQHKEVDDTAFSSVFWVQFALSLLLTALLYVTAPLIAAFYEAPQLTAGLRALSMTLPIGAFSSILSAQLTRKLAFKRSSVASVAAMLVSGLVGIVLALTGYGLWALIVQQILSSVIQTLVLYLLNRWYPKRVFSFVRVKSLLSYGWKMLASNLLGTAYNDLTGLVLGKAFPGDTLAFYNKGRQMPYIVSENLNSIILTALFPTYAANQDDRPRVLDLVRKTMRLDAYIVFPLMCGLAIVAEPLIGVLLTDKWLPAVPYMYLACIVWALYPLDCTLMQAICAMGRSGLHLILEIIRRAVGLGALCIAAFCFKTPMAIAWSVVLTGVFSMVQAMAVSVPFFGYRLIDQIRDALPPLLLCAAMAACAWPVRYLGLSRVPTLAIQAVVGAGVYIGLSALLRLDVFSYLIQAIREYLAKLKEKRNTV